MLKKVKVNNIASLIDFEMETPQKHVLVYGTNGSGKSTLVGLLDAIDRSHRKGGASMSDFIKKRISKECGTSPAEIIIEDERKAHRFTYDCEGDETKHQDENLPPIKVFNEAYTNETIGDEFDMGGMESGIPVGGDAKERDKQLGIIDSMDRKLTEVNSQIETLISDAIKDYNKDTNRSSSSKLISREALMDSECTYHQDDSLRDKILETSRRNDDKEISLINTFTELSSFEEIEVLCNEEISEPNLDDGIKRLLKSYTQFFKDGIAIFEELQEPVCPFCKQDWEEADNAIVQFQSFLESEYNTKRSQVIEAQKRIKSLTDSLSRINNEIQSAFNQIKTIQAFYGVDISSWEEIHIEEIQEKHISVILAELEKKYERMDTSVSVVDHISQIGVICNDVIENNNNIIENINAQIAGLRAMKTENNRLYAQHCMKVLHDSARGHSLRAQYKKFTEQKIVAEKRVAELEAELSKKSRVVNTFNRLMQVMGLDGYELSLNKRLNLKAIDNSTHDISDQGCRISSAQRKMLSLCYFFSEILSEVKSPGELKDFVIVFDDPIDSADYVYMHSIMDLITHTEKIMTNVLDLKEKVKFKQFIVFTHNALLFDRLYSRWSEHKAWRMKKHGGKTVLEKPTPSVNDYVEHVNYLAEYLNATAKGTSLLTKDVTFVGHTIRRVLEIISSFDSLSSNSFDWLQKEGSSKLHLIANHMSHDSFTKMINPFDNQDELRQACWELFELIRIRHPQQHKTIMDRWKIEKPA